MQDTPRSAPKRPATYADIEALPANMVGEILYGVLYAHPRPAKRHGRTAWRLAGQLDGPFDLGSSGPGGWIFVGEPELHLGAHIVVPDIGGWRRRPSIRLPETAISVVPDWICEILSPSTSRYDRTDKLSIYAESGVYHAWYIDPQARTLEVMSLVDEKWQITSTFKDADTVVASPFEAHHFSLDVLWPDDEANPTSELQS